MKKSIQLALEDASAVMEEIKTKLPTMTLVEKVDVGARLRAVAKHADEIDGLVKKDIKAKLKNKAGTVLGEVFKAVMAMIPTSRLNQKALKEAEPELVEKYTETNDQQRITFEPR